jgi:regulator of protease activity HflC (stomatin/prohibitin superfamily)
MIAYSFYFGFIAIMTLAMILFFSFKHLTIKVNEETEVFILSFGKVKRNFTTPGLHFYPANIFPWIKTFTVSKKVDFRTYKNIHVNDHNGTTVILDLWIEFRLSDPYKSMFSVENWEEALESLAKHTTASILCTQTVPEILKHRTELADQLRQSMAEETERWGLTISGAMIQNIGLLPEISKQFFNTVAARIEKTKAYIEEEGRLRVAHLEAETQQKVAKLNGLAKTQLPTAISEVYLNFSVDPKLLHAFQEYWELLHLDPRKTVSFNGFEQSPVKALEASVAIETLLNQ